MSMTKAEALALVGERFGGRTDLATLAESELTLVQRTVLEGGDVLPWFLQTQVSTPLASGVSSVSLDALGGGATALLRTGPEGGIYVGADGATAPESRLFEYAYHQALTASAGGTGQPTACALMGRTLYLFPTTDTDYELFTVGFHRDTAFTSLASGSTNLWLTHAADWLLSEGMARIAMHMQSPLLPLLREEAALARRRVLAGQIVDANPAQPLTAGVTNAATTNI